MAEGDSILTRDFGGLPTWGWVGLAGLGGVAVILMRRRSAEQPVATGFDQPAALADGIPTEQYESLLAILHDLQGRGSTAPTTPTTPPSTPPPSGGTTRGPGNRFTIPKGFVPDSQMGYSHVMRKIMQQFYGQPVDNAKVRSTIWYHPMNAALVAKYAGNWTKLKAGDSIYLPKITM